MECEYVQSVVYGVGVKVEICELNNLVLSVKPIVTALYDCPEEIFTGVLGHGQNSFESPKTFILIVQPPEEINKSANILNRV